jgi:hypothetical protein
MVEVIHRANRVKENIKASGVLEPIVADEMFVLLQKLAESRRNRS